MRFASRSGTLLLAVLHAGAAASACPAGAAPPTETHARAEARHAAHAPEADPAAHHHAPAEPHAASPALAAACPCGCGDTAAPGGIGGRLGFGLLRERPAPPHPAAPAHGTATSPEATDAPGDTPDPVPI